MFFSSLLILNFNIASRTDLSLTKILGFSSVSKFKSLFKSFFAASIICCLFFENKGYWWISLIPANLDIKLNLSDELKIKTLSKLYFLSSFVKFINPLKPWCLAFFSLLPCSKIIIFSIILLSFKNWSALELFWPEYLLVYYTF